MEYFIYFIIFIFGASIASFIHVFVERGDKIDFFKLSNRSYCLNCLKKLNFYELIPVFSYLYLRGKCLTCKIQIPVSLFVGEIVLGVWFLFSYMYFMDSPFFQLQLFFSMIFGSLFYLLTIQDLKQMEVSAKWLFAFVAIGILNAIFNLYTGTGDQYFKDLLVSLFVISPFWIIYLINKNWIGEADPYVFTALALFFDAQFTISLFMYSVWFGTAYALYYLIVVNGKIERNIRIPFLPIIFFSTLFIMIFNFHILKLEDILMLYESVYLS